MKLMQIHHQFADGHTEMVRQLEVESLDELAEATRETAGRHPLPTGAQWLFCEEGAREFVYAAAPNAPRQPRRGSGVGLDAVVGHSGVSE